MAVGDIINDVQAGAYTFQPAATVEIILTTIFTQVDAWVLLTDGVTSINWNYRNDTASGAGIDSNIKTGITNSVYLSSTNVSGGGYTGIQIK